MTRVVSKTKGMQLLIRRVGGGAIVCGLLLAPAVGAAIAARSNTKLPWLPALLPKSSRRATDWMWKMRGGISQVPRRPARHGHKTHSVRHRGGLLLLES